jgi:hypothetical protein
MHKPITFLSDVLLASRCRVVVSGPGLFNSAARSMLTDFVEDDDITVLSA